MNKSLLNSEILSWFWPGRRDTRPLISIRNSHHVLIVVSEDAWLRSTVLLLQLHDRYDLQALLWALLTFGSGFAFLLQFCRVLLALSLSDCLRGSHAVKPICYNNLCSAPTLTSLLAFNPFAAAWQLSVFDVVRLWITQSETSAWFKGAFSAPLGRPLVVCLYQDFLYTSLSRLERIHKFRHRKPPKKVREEKEIVCVSQNRAGLEGKEHSSFCHSVSLARSAVRFHVFGPLLHCVDRWVGVDWAGTWLAWGEYSDWVGGRVGDCMEAGALWFDLLASFSRSRSGLVFARSRSTGDVVLLLPKLGFVGR